LSLVVLSFREEREGEREREREGERERERERKRGKILCYDKAIHFTKKEMVCV